MSSPIGPIEDHALWPVLELTRQLAAPNDLQTKLTQVIEAARLILSADRGTIFLYDYETDELYSEVATGAKQLRFSAKLGVAGRCAQSRAIVNVPDCYADPDFNPAMDRQTGYHTRCSLSVPLIGLEDKLVGVMQLLNKLSECPFTDADVQVAQALAAQAAVSLQTQRLIDEYILKQKMERDIALAREIQSRVLPSELPKLPGYELAGWSAPADETGGDIYDVIPVDGMASTGAMLLLGDATGHGIGPALSVTQVRAMLRIAMRLNAKLEDIFGHVNDQLCDDLPANRFVTVFMGILDTGEHRIRYHAGGQGPLVHYSAADQSCRFIDASTFPLGIMAGVPLGETQEIAMAPGDVFGLLSDGIYEYADHTGKQFADAGVETVLKQHHDAPMNDLIDHIRTAVAKHAQGAPQADDMTILLIKRSA